jgi:acetoin utilization deacetylase AcuC-like enzyme
LNLPLRAATRASEQKRAFEAALEEMAASFSPDLIIISAGFDSHIGDPLGQLLLADDDFVAMTRAVKQWAGMSCEGRLVSCLEGGYNLETLGETVRAHVEELSHE